MTEHDRGAYMPQNDAPLAFDARAPRGGGRPMPMTLIASGGVLVLILGALFLAYRGGVRGAAENAPVRTVGQPVAAIKVAPAPGAQPQDPDAGLDVYAAQNVPAEAAKPTFTAPPEQPHARPAPQQLAAAAAPSGLQVTSVSTPPVRIEDAEAVTPSASPRTTIKAGVADQKGAAAALTARPVVVAAAPARPTPVKSAPAPVAVAQPPIKLAEAAKPAPAIKVAAVKPAPATAVAAKADEAKVAEAPPLTPTGGGAAAVQIGAFSSRGLASKGYADVSAAMSGRMDGHGSHVEPVAKDGKTMFRTTVTGFADRTAAKSFCAALSAKGHTCFVKAG